MLERETEIIQQILTEKTIGQAERISLREILAADIPRNVQVFFQSEVTRWLSEDLRSSTHVSAIASTPTKSALVRDFVRSVSLDYEFDKAAFLDALENAIHFLQNYLCRPQWTLEHFVFEKSDTVPFDLFLSKLSYLVDYQYFGTVLERVIRKNGWETIPRDAFRSLVKKIDDQIVQRHTRRDLALLAKPIFDFLYLGDSPVDRAIPVKPLLVFLHDKGLVSLKEFVEAASLQRGVIEISLDDFASMVSEYAGGSTLQGAPQPAPIAVDVPAPPSVPQAEPPAPPATEASTESGEATAPSLEETTPSQPVEGHSTNQTLPLMFEDEKPAQVPPSDNERQRRNHTLSLTFAGMQETRTSKRLPSIFSLVTEEQKERFIKTVFNGDEAYYAGVLTALDQMTSWDDAAAYLKEFFETNELDPFSDEVIEFTDTIQKRYIPEAADRA